jgi:hypothetical protein
MPEKLLKLEFRRRLDDDWWTVVDIDLAPFLAAASLTGLIGFAAALALRVAEFFLVVWLMP